MFRVVSWLLRVALLVLLTSVVACGEDGPLPARLAPSDLTLDQVLAKHVEARGGLDKLRAITSVEMTGKMTNKGPSPTENAPIVIAIRVPDRFARRFERETGVVSVQAIDGGMAWQYLPDAGINEPTAMPEIESQRFRRKIDIEGPWVDWQSKGHQVVLRGKGELDGRGVYALQVGFADSESTYLYLDAETFLPSREILRVFSEFGRTLEAEITYHDYMEAGGVIWPGREEVTLPFGGFHQIIRWQQIEVNLDLDDDRFSMPQELPPGEASGQ